MSACVSYRHLDLLCSPHTSQDKQLHGWLKTLYPIWAKMTVSAGP
jgi:hypothetical protein